MNPVRVVRDWPSVELRRLVKTSGGMTPSKAVPGFWGGDVPWVSPKDMKTFRVSGSIDTITPAAVRVSGIELLAPGAVLMVTRGMILEHTVPIALNAVPITVNQDMKALVCLQHLQPEYLAWALLGHQDELLARVEVAGHGTCALRTDQWGALPLPLPPLDEQTQIAKFLDYETAKIDQLIDKQQQLIALLKEKRQSVLHSAVSEAGTRDARLEHCWDVVSRPVDRCDDEIYYPIGLYNRGRGIFHKEPRIGADLGDSDFFFVHPGDLVLSGQFAWEGAVALAGEDELGTVATHRYPIVRGRDGLTLTEYLWAYFASDTGDMLLNEASRGAAGRNRPLNMNSLKKEKIPVPPLRAQQRVASVVHQERKLVDRIRVPIELLQERRTALISAAVTGKIDVRNWQPPEAEATQEVA